MIIKKQYIIYKVKIMQLTTNYIQFYYKLYYFGILNLNELINV